MTFHPAARHVAGRASLRALLIATTACGLSGAHAATTQIIGTPSATPPGSTSDRPVPEVKTPSAASSAASTSIAPNTPTPEDEIVVTGTRPIAESVAAALRIQKESPALVSVIASDAVGRLPDQNVAQAVSRLPGVGVQRDQGQARYINLRGAPINWTTLSFDGINVISPEGRDARFDSIPSAIASQIVVRKAVTPNMTGETIAGNVDIITRSAFDYNGFHVAGKAGGGYVELGKRQEYEGQLVVSDRWDTDAGEFGVLLSGSYYQRDMVTDNAETDWEVVPTDRRPGNADRVWARETENKLYRLTRRNYSASGKLEWKPTQDHRLFVSSIYSAFTDDELRNNYIVDMDDQESRLASGATPAAILADSAACAINPVPRSGTTGYADVCTGNTPFQGTVYGVDLNANVLVREYLQSVFTNTVGGDHDFGRLKMRWRGNYTRSVDDRSAPAQLNYDSPGFGSGATAGTNRVTIDYDLTDKQKPRFSLFRTIRNADGTFGRGAAIAAVEDVPGYALTRVRGLKAKDITTAYTGKLDFSYDTDLFGETKFLFGAQYDNRKKESNERLLDIPVSASANPYGLPLSYSAVAVPGNPAYKGEYPLGYLFQYHSKQRAIDVVEQAAAGGAQYVANTANFYNVREEVFAGYAMFETKMDWGSIVGGARVEHIKNQSTAFATVNTTTSLVSIPRDQTLVYPSLHLNWDLDQTKKLRLSFNTGASRPDYDQLRPNLTISDANQTISGGNPDAEPERAKGVDLYFEWYMQPQGYFSIGAFYKDVKDTLFNTTRPFGSESLNLNGVDRSQYIFSGIANGGDGYIWGFEAALQQQIEGYQQDLGLPDWTGGFGILLNGTYNNSEAETPDGRKVMFPGTSKWVMNASLFYEKYGFSARVSYQNRTKWIDAIGAFAVTNGVFRGTTGGDEFWARDDELDASLRYAITPNLEVYADFANLLNGPGRRFAGVSARTLERETFGRRYTGGIRFNF
ncbi:TonB-dependent receptor [Sphingomonas jatrophae]|uniref:TonB-dependent receptor n=1 Tax=Sphingomonas jatrophae TaxID=1166337 RepID=A0A1I6J9Q8_9SPHN|nr:TonB-dependent receptor [Sphingomonas jatrophae]SFR75696.1 TonB-dependent receptor [Sphingomonas jatrophae]